MNEQHRAAGDTPGPTPSDAELAARITRALHARVVAEQPDAAVVAARLRVQAAGRGAQPAPARALHRGGRIAVAGLVTGTLAVAGAGAAAAANPYSDVARAVEGAARAVGIDWSVMPDGYTRDQYEAFWDAYGVEDAAALSNLWQTDVIEAKARAGQMLLDGEAPPVDLAHRPGSLAPGTTVPGADRAPSLPPDPADVFWDAGYTLEDADALGALWGTDTTETKARAAELLLAGEPLPVPPSGVVGGTDTEEEPVVPVPPGGPAPRR